MSPAASTAAPAAIAPVGRVEARIRQPASPSPKIQRDRVRSPGARVSAEALAIA